MTILPRQAGFWGIFRGSPKIFNVAGGSAVEYLTTPAVAAAIDGVQKVEVSLVLDVSGSMGNPSASGRDKIEDLQIAAKQFVDALLLDAPHADTYSISIVPYSFQVSAGSALLNNMNVSNEHNYSYCVDWTTSDYNTTEVNQSVEQRRAGFIAVRDYSRHHYQNLSASHWLWSCPTASDRQILPLSGNRTALRNYIDALTPRGNTSTEMGIKWGAALLDPSMRPVVDDMITDGTVDPMFSGRPNTYGEEGILKVIVAMTDGANTYSYELLDPYRTGMSNVWRQDTSGTDSRIRYWVYNPSHSGSNKYRYLKYSTGGSLKISQWVAAPSTDAEHLSMAKLWRVATTYFVADRLEYKAGLSKYDWGTGTYRKYGPTVKDQRMAAICAAAKANNILL
ncbi:hypothetical protein [Profundibacter sp.]|uniref:hypothetical protein n=1 Tax=Profundibacter sp. TaxID=3101071 RepID=UPI003D0BAFAE